MKYTYEIENIYPGNITFEEIKESICKKIARIIINKEYSI